ncbi:MAG: hypothetical protein RQ866_08270, partial [Bacteroidales bacterium]|nr:hypothetical protein [Bacteroidales bacterium]
MAKNNGITDLRNFNKRGIFNPLLLQPLLIFLFVSFLLPAVSYSQTKYKNNNNLQNNNLPKPDSIEIPFIDSVITLINYSMPAKTSFLYFVIHDNEKTASYTAMEALCKFGGVYLEFKNSGTYFVSFLMDSVRYTFNPNRIFTLQGAENTLEEHGPCNPLVAWIVYQLGNNMAELLLADKSMIITLHNNRDEGFSIHSYHEEYKPVEGFSAVHINPDHDPDDFYYVNDTNDFNYIKSLNFNVVLQSNKEMINDGSVSVWAAMKGIPYINIEAEHEHYEEQIEMLEAILPLIR